MPISPSHVGYHAPTPHSAVFILESSLQGIEARFSGITLTWVQTTHLQILFTDADIFFSRFLTNFRTQELNFLSL